MKTVLRKLANTKYIFDGTLEGSRFSLRGAIARKALSLWLWLISHGH